MNVRILQEVLSVLHKFLFTSNIYLFLFQEKSDFQAVCTVEWNVCNAKKGNLLLFFCIFDCCSGGKWVKAIDLERSWYIARHGGRYPWDGRKSSVACCLVLNFPRRKDSGPAEVSGILAIHFAGSRFKPLWGFNLFSNSEENNSFWCGVNKAKHCRRSK